MFRGVCDVPRISAGYGTGVYCYGSMGSQRNRESRKRDILWIRETAGNIMQGEWN